MVLQIDGAVGSRKWIGLFREPDPSRFPQGKEDPEFSRVLKHYEAHKSFELGVVYLEPDILEHFQMKMRQIGMDETKRKRKLKEEFTEDDAKDLYSDRFFTEEGVKALRSHCREALVAMGLQIRGVTIRGDDGEDMSTERAITELERLQLHEHAYMRAVGAQVPSVEQVF